MSVHDYIVEWTDDDIDDHMLGSGVAGEGCVRTVVLAEDLDGYRVFMDDPESPDGLCRWYTIKRDALRRVASEIVSGSHVMDKEIRDDIRCDDIDAVAANVIIQIAAYGEIIYS